MTYTLKIDVPQDELIVLRRALDDYGWSDRAQIDSVAWALQDGPGPGLTTLKLDWSDEHVNRVASALVEYIVSATARMSAAEDRLPGGFRDDPRWRAALGDETAAWSLLQRVASYRQAAGRGLAATLDRGEGSR